MRENSGKLRRTAVVATLALAVSLVPALGAVALNRGSAATSTPTEAHAYKDSLGGGTFAYYRTNHLKHNIGHHNRHHTLRVYLPA